MRLSEATIAISGLGLMGGSLGMALRSKCRHVVGVARRAEVHEQALRLGAVDSVACDLSEGAARADIVILATPVRDIIQSIPVVAQVMRPGALLMDLGSTKGDIVRAMNRVPEGVFAVGGHPMCGKETGGIESAEVGLFSGARFVLTPTLRATDSALSLAHEVAEAVGAVPIVLDAETHDRAVAIVSHLPYLLAATLVRTEEIASGGERKSSLLAASGFRDTSRLAASQVEMMLDILLTNHDAVLEALDLFEQQLADVRELLSQPDALRSWMVQVRSRRMEMFR